MSKAGSSYGCARRSAATTSSCRSAGKTVSSRSSATRSSLPRSPIDGLAASPARNVPVLVEVDEAVVLDAGTIEEWASHRQSWEFALLEGHEFGRANNVEARILF